MRSKRRLAAAVAAALVVCLAVLGASAAACGGDDGTEAVSTPTVHATPVPKVPKTPRAGGITVVARNVAFDTDELFAPAGSLTITLDNRDGGTAHNLHVFRGADAHGESAGETTLMNGPSEESVDLELAPGDYFFQCDVHPSMKGTLTVSTSP